MSYHRDLSAELKEEVALMNKFLLQFIDTDELTKKVFESIEKEVNSSPENFVNEDEVRIREDDIDRHIERTFQYIYDWEDNIPSVMYEVVHEKIDGGALEGLEDEIREMIIDAREYERDPLGYHGMSQKDFI